MLRATRRRATEGRMARSLARTVVAKVIRGGASAEPLWRPLAGAWDLAPGVHGRYEERIPF